MNKILIAIAVIGSCFVVYMLGRFHGYMRGCNETNIQWTSTMDVAVSQRMIAWRGGKYIMADEPISESVMLVWTDGNGGIFEYQVLRSSLPKKLQTQIANAK